MLFLAIIVLGLFAGWVGQVVLNGVDTRIDWPLALGAGFAGSLVGGLLFSLLAGDGFAIRPSGLIGSVVGATIVTAAYRYFAHRRR